MDLHDLPLEILQQIACYLADSHRPSLHAFSLASKACHKVAAMLTFRQIHIEVLNRKELQRDMDDLSEALSRTDSARYVYALSLKGFLDTGKPRNEKGRWHDIDPLGWWTSLHTDEIWPDQEPVPTAEYFVYDESVIKRGSDEDMAWAPVVDLVRKLPHLAQLIYNCPNQFPPSLLETLHEHQPQCKLHHLTFRMRTLLWDTPFPYEMALATSPCLYSVKVLCTWRDSEGDDDFNEEATRDLVAGLAPNLKEVVIVRYQPGRSSRWFRRRPQWKRLPGLVPGGMTGNLTSLSLTGGIPPSPGVIQDWAECTNFSSLRHLSIGGRGGWHLVGLNGEAMGWITQNYAFPLLETLHVVLERDDEYVERPEYSDIAATFFASFEPLKELSVSGPLEPKILDTILYRHGRSLGKLTLRPLEVQFQSHTRVRREMPMIFTKNHILQIRSQCPSLEGLTIPVKRIKSSLVEVEMYRAIANMERLKSLFLILDCSDWRPFRDSAYESSIDQEFDEDDRGSWIGNDLRKGHLQVALINCAVDEPLARSIWDVISQAKVGKKLDSLKLWTTGAGAFGNGQDYIERFRTNMSRSWLIERLPRSDEDIISIRELDRARRVARDDWGRDLERRGARERALKKFYGRLSADEWREYLKEHGKLPEPLSSDLEAESDSVDMQVFRRLWPRKEGSKNWREDWSGLPLQV